MRRGSGSVMTAVSVSSLLFFSYLHLTLKSLGLGHCRLSIEDLSDAGNQPIHSKNNDVHAAINGEIYDHERIRDELAQKHRYHFKSHNDSEVAVALYTIYSTPAFLDLRGEFSLIIYDQRQGRVIAARDRFGIKPLFWTVFDEGDKRVLLFATEAKAFLGMGWKPRWDVQSIFQGGWVIDDRTLFKGVKKLIPGHWMEIMVPGGKLRRHHTGMQTIMIMWFFYLLNLLS